MGYLRQFMNAWRDEAATTRVFFPDNGELAIALSGQTQDPAAGRAALEPTFGETRFQLGYLTKQNALRLQVGGGSSWGARWLRSQGTSVPGYLSTWWGKQLFHLGRLGCR